MGQYYSEFTVDGVKKDIYDKHAVHLDDFAEVFEAQLLQSVVIKTVILDLYFPIGTAIIRRDNPGVTIGGEWEQLKDVTIVGAGGKFEYGLTGGSADPVLPRHTHEANGSTNAAGDHIHIVDATAEPAGYHSHSLSNLFSSGAGGGLARYKTSSDRMSGMVYTDPVGNHTHHVSGTALSAGGHSHSFSVYTEGSGETDTTNKNYPPFKALNIWLRVR